MISRSHAKAANLAGRGMWIGLLYWLAFLLLLEPGNVLRAAHGGHALTFTHEAVRITAAALLGTLVTPVFFVLTRRFPLRGQRRGRNALVHTASTTATAFGLIVISCFAAAWLFEGRLSPSLSSVLDQLVRNWPLLTFAIAALIAIAQLLIEDDETNRPPPAHIAADHRIAARSRGRLIYVEWADVDWIETQGNYCGRHVGPACHLVRATVAGIARRLEAGEFIRVHRRAMVAVRRIEALRPLPNGDAMLTLAHGHEVRVSRRYRKTLNEAWQGYRPPIRVPAAAEGGEVRAPKMLGKVLGTLGKYSVNPSPPGPG